MLKLLLVFVALLSTQCYGIDDMFGPGWMNNIQENIRRSMDDTRNRIESMANELQRKINDELRESREREEEIRRRTETMINEMANAARAGNATNGTNTFGNIPIGSGMQASGHSYSFNSNSNMGTSKFVRTGVSSNGDGYRQETEEQIINGILHHDEKIVNLRNGTVTQMKYTLNLTDPNAQPVYDETVNNSSN